MKLARLFTLLTLLAVAAMSFSQAWIGAYDSGLRAAKANRWDDARKSFQQAAAYRPEDQSTPTILPGPASEQRRWRNGQPYSPNFLAAYSAYRSGVAANDPEAKRRQLEAAAAEWETLLAKEQVSRPTLFFLGATYTALGNTAKRDAVLARGGTPAEWKVDLEVLTADERALFTAAGVTTPAGTPANTTVVTPTDSASPIITAGDKFALIIGNTESRISGGRIPFAGEDAQRIREALIKDAGYTEANIDMVLNATAGTIRTSARALADRVKEGGTVFIYFTGVGANVAGKDFLAGIDAENANDMTGMIGKMELYSLFMAKGARVFAFFQANRPIVGGRFFGQEVPMVGSISQSQATLPGETVNSIVRNGKTYGIYTDAFATVLGEMRSNRVPILEFGWQVFYKIRRGDTGSVGGGSRQTPTLPVLTNMASDARF